ncbi:MAG: dTDP-4-dehydrorhamnose reductase [Desulfobacterota bacterium]|nr:dTDP-4-dehydrorhamnose reductase [Thermodesulfobacteriota bacterium]MDW8001804.1 dTDP-4-dehydrorhamnose reductase [Deltaproteobacteria bacterium]
MRILFAGGKGLIGKNIVPFFLRFYECSVFDIEDWDILDEKKGKEIIKDLKPDIVVNLAAYTDVDGCEENTELAEMVNVYGAEIVARLCAENGIRLVHFSTDYVFDGKKNLPYIEEDVAVPLSVYGRTKLEGEKRVLAIHPNPLIIRTQWIYGHGGKNFVTKILEVSKTEKELYVVNDQFGSPTYAKDLAEPLKLLIDLKRNGIYHLSNSGICTWYELACEVFRIKQVSTKVIPVSSNEIKRKAKRPAFSALSTQKLKGETGYTLRHWKEALKEYLAEI